MRKKINNSLFILLIALFLFFLLWPLFHQGIFVSDDGGWMIIRLSAFHQSLKDGLFPVRWVERLNYGFGYPIFNFNYPGVFYLGEIIHLLSFNFTNSIKILFGMGMLSSGIFSYLWLKTKFNNLSALTGALIYLYAPYHLFDLYSRGSLGEIVALGVIPAIFYFLKKNNFLFTGLSVCLLILSHNTLALLFLPVIIIYILINQKKLKENLISIILGILISSFFFVPALYDRQFTIFDSVAVSNWQEYFLNQQNFHLLGWGSIFVLIFSTFMILYRKYCHCEESRLNQGDEVTAIRRDPAEAGQSCKKIPPFFFLISLVSIFLSSAFSSFLWQILPLPKLVQFPWRFLALSILGVSYLSAWLVAHSGKIRVLIGGLLVLLFFLPSLRCLSNLNYLTVPDTYYSTNEDPTAIKNEYLPIWAKYESPKERAKQLYEVYLGQADIQIVKNKSNQLILKTNLKKSANIKINKLYFPGWNLKINDQKVNLDSPYYQLSASYGDGLIRIPLLPETKKIELYWSETPIRLISDIISLIALFLLILFSRASFWGSAGRRRLQNQ